jgi:hypothetical protein
MKTNSCSSSASQLPWLFFFAHYFSSLWCAQQQLLTGDASNTASKNKLLFVVCSRNSKRENDRWYYITCWIHAYIFTCNIIMEDWTNGIEKVDKFEIDSTLLLELLFERLRTKNSTLDWRMSHTLIGILLIWMKSFDDQLPLSLIDIVCLASMLGLVSLNEEFDVSTNSHLLSIVAIADRTQTMLNGEIRWPWNRSKYHE